MPGIKIKEEQKIMIINHNMASLNTYRQLSANNANSAKSLEKLSSGLRINRAGDDAAGLAISEKMRGQIRGLDQASRNAQDSISLIQTAEGALNETHSILQRMRELAVQSSNDTATDNDRSEMQKEVAQLKTEIDRIANNTEFNTKKLLNGSLESAKTAQGTIVNSQVLKNAAGTNITSGIAATTMLQDLKDSDGNNLGLKGGDVINISGLKNGSAISATLTVAGITTTTANVESGTGANNVGFAIASTDSMTFEYKGQSYTIAYGSTATTDTTTLATVQGQLQAQMRAAVGDNNITVNLTNGTATGDSTFTFTSSGNYDVKVTGSTNATLNTAITTGTTASTTHLSDLLTSVQGMTGVGSNATVNSSGQIQVTGVNGTSNALSDMKMSATNRTLFNNKMSAFSESQTAQDNHVDSSLVMHIGANENQTMKVDINEMSVQRLALSSANVSTQQGAETAITAINNAIQTVSAERSKLGASQNRLEHTIANLGTSSENLTAAESRIRDVDMAKEMMNFQKNNILSQAAQAMLAQANQAPQGVLQLLR
jgi:flagellin